MDVNKTEGRKSSAIKERVCVLCFLVLLNTCLECVPGGGLWASMSIFFEEGWLSRDLCFIFAVPRHSLEAKATACTVPEAAKGRHGNVCFVLCVWQRKKG